MIQEVELLKSGKEKSIHQVYHAYRNEFLAWAVLHFDCSRDDAKHIYQDAFISTYENAVSGRIDGLKASLKTYIFSVGRNKLLAFFRSKKVMSLNVELDENLNLVEEEEFEFDELEVARLRSVLQKIGEACRTLLSFFYYDKKNMEEICSLLGYQSSNSAKTQKYKCIMRLRKLYFE